MYSQTYCSAIPLWIHCFDDKFDFKNVTCVNVTHADDFVQLAISERVKRTAFSSSWNKFNKSSKFIIWSCVNIENDWPSQNGVNSSHSVALHFSLAGTYLYLLQPMEKLELQELQYI